MNVKLDDVLYFGEVYKYSRPALYQGLDWAKRMREAMRKHRRDPAVRALLREMDEGVEIVGRLAARCTA